MVGGSSNKIVDIVVLVVIYALLTPIFMMTAMGGAALMFITGLIFFGLPILMFLGKWSFSSANKKATPQDLKRMELEVKARRKKLRIFVIAISILFIILIIVKGICLANMQSN